MEFDATGLGSNGIKNALENPEYKWRTIPGVAREASVSENEVVDFIHRNQDFVVQSSVPSKEGQPLFTTRQHFRDKNSPIVRLFGAFKNRAY